MSKSKPAATLHQVAERAGVSAMTVSRVVNHSSSVTDETRKRVLRAIKDTGYRVPPVERRFRSALRRKQRIRTGNIGLLFPDPNVESMRTTLAAELIHGVEEAVQEAGLNLMVGHLRGKSGIPGFLSDRNVDGVIVRGGGSDLLSAAIRGAIQELPHVTVMGFYPGLGATGDYVQPDNEAVGMQAAMVAQAQGARQLAILNFDSGNLSFQTRRDACLRACRVQGLRPTVIEAPLEKGEDAMAEFSKLSDGMDSCFVCGCTHRVDEHALEEGFHSLGFTRAAGKVPVVTLYVSAIGFRKPTDLYLLDLRVPQLGKLAVAQLLRRIQAPGDPFCRIAIEPEFLKN